MASCVMKQLREKHVSSEIKKCSWSPKMDLLATANAQGQVALHRLSWQQVWVLNPSGDNVRVTAIAWRPDSKVLSVGYTSGKVYLVNIEDSSLIHQLEFGQGVTALSWNKYSNNRLKTDEKEETQDPWVPYMYSLPPLSKSFSESSSQTPSDVWQEPRLLQDQTDLNVLSIGTEGAHLHMFAFGLFHLATIDVCKNENESKSRIVHVVPSSTLDTFSIILEKEMLGEQVMMGHVLLHASILALRQKELHYLAQKYGQIHSLMTYAKHTLTLMEEAWETTLIEMDAKLASYSTTVPEEGVSADFLDLLVFGHLSTEFEMFLSNKLTEKSLKKLRHSVDLCYSTMQRLVVRHLQQVGVTLIFLLSQLEGMSKRKDRFTPLGVQEKEVKVAMGQAGSFLLKAAEMLQAIETSMKDFHTFVRWVSGVHLRLIHEPSPPDLSRMSQQEMTNLLTFLNESFEQTETGSDGERRTRFRLERVGQYLKDESLKMPPTTEDTPFTRLVNTHPTLASHSLIFDHHRETSLMQEHDRLYRALIDMGAQPSVAIAASISVGKFSPLAKLDSVSQAAVAQISLTPAADVVVCAFVPIVKQSVLFLVEWSVAETKPTASVKCASFYFCGDGSPSPGVNMGIIDVYFYSSETISLLLHDPGERRASLFAQVSLEVLRSKLQDWPIAEGVCLADSGLPFIEATSLPDALSMQRLEVGPASMMAVSGPRKVTAVIGENRRRVRIYEMEVEEDDDEEEDEDIKNESVVNACVGSDVLNDTL